MQRLQRVEVFSDLKVEKFYNDSCNEYTKSKISKRNESLQFPQFSLYHLQSSSKNRRSDRVEITHIRSISFSHFQHFQYTFQAFI